LSFWQSPDAGETPFHHFIVLPLPERTTYTILAFSRARRAYLLSFWQSPDVGERANRLQEPMATYREAPVPPLSPSSVEQGSYLSEAYF